MASAEHDLVRLNRFKRTEHADAGRLGVDVIGCFKQLEKRHKKFGRVGEAWLQLVPPALQNASELSTFSRGALGVVVEGSANLFLLKQAMLNGLQDQLLHACRGEGLKKITLKAGKLSA